MLCLDGSANVLHQCVTVKTTNIRELKHATTTVLEWVEQGEIVQITRRNKVVAILSPPQAEKPKKAIRRDFEKDLQDIFGDRIMPTTGTEIVSYGRGER
jgi:antitoxin (DNA-binding transcriptional repressor) of toxin-antitoxin stability system